MRKDITTGGNLRDSLRLAESLGCSIVKPRNNGGEYVVSHPDMERKVRLNGRRKDTPRSLTSLLRHIGGLG